MASRWARRRSSSPSAATAGPRTRKFLVPDGVREHFAATASASAAARSATGLGRAASKRYRARHPDLADELRCMQDGRPAAGLGCRHPELPGRCQGRRRRAIASGKVLNAIAPKYPVADRRLGRSRALDQDAAHLRGRRRSRGRQPMAAATSISASASMRWAPICNGLAPVEAAAVRLGLPDLQRLHEAGDPPRCADGAAGHPHLHARFDRRRRGRPDASADRAAAWRCAPSRASSRLRPADANEVAEAWRVMLA